MKCNIQRIKNDFDFITKITATPGKGCTRFSYSKEDLEVRNYLLEQLEELNLKVTRDPVGNIRAKMRGFKDSPSIFVGSHIDTVKNGGKYDGLTGVLAGLEAIRIFKESDYVLKHPLELIIFSEEEGSNFSTTMFGSKSLLGDLEVDDFKRLKTSNGVLAYEVLRDVGYNPEEMKNFLLEEEELCAMIELHIEQGEVLDQSKKSIGIVTGISGMRTLEITISGISNHAGTTPMELRKNSLVISSKIILEIEKIVKDFGKGMVATVGQIENLPNVPNVIPGKTKFTIDIRHVEDKCVENTIEKIIKKIEDLEKDIHFEYKFRTIAKSKGETLSKKMINSIEKATNNLNIEYKKMTSGAVHDAAILNRITDVGMIFIPSIHGISHSPDEKTKIKDIENGTNVLIETIRILNK